MDAAQQPIHTRIVAAVRAVLALSSLAAVRLDPTEPTRFVAATYAGLIVYVAFSVLSVVRAQRDDSTAPGKLLYWVDIALITYLIALTGGINSIFFPFYFLSILQASFTQGFREGIACTLRATAAFLFAGIVAAPEQGRLEVDRVLD